MRKSAWITALCLSVAGILLVTIALFAVNFDFSRLDTNEYISETYTIEKDFFTIISNTDTADIQFLPSEDGTCRVVCEQMNVDAPITAEIWDNQLYITQENFRNWYDYIGFSFKSAKVTVYLPLSAHKLSLRGSTGDITIHEGLTFSKVGIEISTGDIQFDSHVNGTLNLKTSTGSIECRNVSCQDIALNASTGSIRGYNLDCFTMEMKASTGNIYASDLDCYTMDVKASTGDIQIKDSDITTLKVTTSTGDVDFQNTFSGNLNAVTDTGDVSFKSCNGDYLYIQTDTGDVTGTFSRRMIFFCKSNTGDIDVDKYNTGGECEVVTDTGDIHLRAK